MSLRRSGYAAVLAAAAVLMLLPALAGARALNTGVSNPDPVTPEAMSQIVNTGAKFARIPVGWAPTAPEVRPASWNPADPEDPAYNWRVADEAVKNAVAAGLTPVLQVDGAPTWAQRCRNTEPGAFASSVCDPDPAELRAFATAAATRYSGRVAGLPAVRYWQALNEPNLSIFFSPQFGADGKPVSPYLYRDLVNAFYAGVKAVDPGNLVILAGLGPIARPKYTIGPLQFTRLLLCMKNGRKPKPTKGNCGGGVNFDIFAIHPYTTGSPDHEGGPNDVQLGDLKDLTALIKAADKANRINSTFARTPLWITEFSWDSKPPDPGGLPMKILTRWAAEALHRAWSAGVDYFFWYSLRDGEHNPGVPYSQTVESGLYFRGPTVAQDTMKPFVRAFHFPFVAYPGKKLSFWGRTPTGTAGKVKVQLQKNGKWKTVKSLRANRFGIFHGKLGTDYGNDRKGAARAVFAGHTSAAFAMKAVADFYHPPFG